MAMIYGYEAKSTGNKRKKINILDFTKIKNFFALRTLPTEYKGNTWNRGNYYKIK